ncbi:unnamed protein product [Diatraea saccharalis]|uniref:Peptidase S1 domain-containing protein n=1 Tax=Diatraea saccharalis TaxID=40085 RepID=A0A9N9RC05_9NEOP|nr:unnamed protein product [Diatraea saccharalis]
MSNDEFSHDIALLKTKKTIKFDGFVEPIQLAYTPIVKNKVATIAGFGYSEKMDFRPREGKVRLYYCGVRSGVLCSNGPVRSAKGDSGGPLIIDGQLSGVISTSCLNEYKTNNCRTVYVNILENYLWINITISEK